MNKSEIEKIALEVCDPLDARKIGTYAVCEFARRFLERIDAERGKSAVAFASRDHEDLAWKESAYFTIPLFLSPTPTIPPGMCLVPIEPTHDMKVAGWREGLGRNDHERLGTIYKAMIAAAQGGK